MAVLAFRDAGKLRILIGAGGMGDRVDRHREHGLRQKGFVQRVTHAHAVAHGGERHSGHRLVALGVVDQRRVKHKVFLAGLLVAHGYAVVLLHGVIVGVRQAQGRVRKRRRVCEDQVFLQRLAVQSVAHAQAGQDVCIGGVAVHLLGQVAALFRLRLQNGQVGGFEACAGAAHEKGRRLRALHQPRLLDRRALAHNRRHRRGHAVQRPFQHMASFFNARQLAAVRALAQLHAQLVGAVAQDGLAGFVCSVVQVVVDLLPRTGAFLLVVDGFRVHNRLIAAGAKAEVLHALLALFHGFLAPRLFKQLRAALKQFLLVALAHGHGVFHDEPPFMSL